MEGILVVLIILLVLCDVALHKTLNKDKKYKMYHQSTDED